MVWADPAAAMGAEPDQQAFYVAGPESLTWTRVQTLNESGYVALSRDVIEHPPATGALSTPGPYSSLGIEASPLVVAVIGVALLEVVMIIGPAFAVGARRSRRQLALVAVSGGSPADLRRIVRAGGVVQGIVAGIVGGLAGLALGGVVLATLFKDSFAGYAVPWREWVVAIVAATVLGLCAAALPARSAGRADPLPALTGAPEPAVVRHRTWGAPVVAALGLAACGYGLAADRPTIALGGAVGVEVALVLAVGPIVSLLARLGGRLRLIPRLALRDAARQRGRTAPALAAIVVCVAGSVLALVYSNTAVQAGSSLTELPVAPGLIAVGPRLGTSSDAALDQAARSLEHRVPGLKAIPVHVAAAATEGSDATAIPTIDNSRCAEPVPSTLVKACKQQQYGVLADTSQWTVQLSQNSQASTLVDDGTFIGATGLDGASDAARALREGKVLVNTPLALNRSGDVVLDVLSGPVGSGNPVGRKVTVPGYVVPWSDMMYQLVLPPQTLGELGMKVIPAGYLGVPAKPLTSDQRAQVEAVLAEGGVQGSIYENPAGIAPWLLLLAVVATVIAAAVAWVVVGLAAVDSRPDLGVLTAVGAAPSARRLLAGAQAGVIAVIGTILGAAGGLVLAVAMVRYQAQLPANSVADWSLHLQWVPLATVIVGVPLVAIAGSVLVTRSRQITVRRAA